MTDQVKVLVLRRGASAYVNVLGARYSSEELQRLAKAGQHKVVVHVNPGDSRALRCYAETGERLSDLLVCES